MLQAFNRVTPIIIWLLFISMMVVLVWGMNKGFDFSDEGFSLLSLTNGQEQGMEIMPVYVVLQKLFSAFNPGVVFYRLLRLMLFLTGMAIFVTGLISYLRRIAPETNWPLFSITYPIAVLCGLINYSIFYQSLSYNSLTFILILIASGFLLKSLSHSGNASQNRVSLLQMAVGLSCGILFQVKLSSGILLSVASLFLLVTSIPEKEKRKFILETIVVFVSGFSVSLLLLYVAGSSPVEFAANFKMASAILPGHQFSQLLEVYRDDLEKNFLDVIMYHKSFLLMPVVLWLMYRYEFMKMFVLTVIFCCILLIMKFIDQGWYKSGMEGISSASMVYILLIWFYIVFILMEFIFILMIKKNKPTTSSLLRSWPVFLLLFFCPFAASAGTNNPISVHITQFLFFWIILLLIFIKIIADQNCLTKFVSALLALMLLLMVSAQFLYGYIRSPYRLNQALNHQTIKLEAGTRSGSLLLDETTCNFVNTIMNILKQHGYHDGDYHALSLYSYPGLVYLSGANSPGAAWYFSDGYEGNDKANCFMISKTKMADLKRTVIFLDNYEPVSAEFSECLKSKGILFPENYFCADSVVVPDSAAYLKIYLPIGIN